MAPARRFPQLWDAQWLRQAAARWTDDEIAAQLGCVARSVAERRAAFGILPNMPTPKGVGGAERLRTLWIASPAARAATLAGRAAYRQHRVCCCSEAEWLTWWLEAARVADLTGQVPALAVFCEDATPDWCDEQRDLCARPGRTQLPVSAIIPSPSPS